MKSKLKAQESNHTTMKEFFLVGFSDVPNLQWILFGIFLVIYLIILMGNGIIILITRVDTTLQKPMYFFLGNFSFLEICYVTTTVPRMLRDIWTKKGSISFLGCATQMCFVLIFGGTECLLLAVMAYDRYVAICNPLHYPLVMNHRVCVQLVAGSWISGLPFEIGQTGQIFSLSFCGSNIINHFFCDIPPILKLACGDTFVNEMLVYIVAVVFFMVPFMLIVTSYGKIITNILKLSSVKGRAKAFSTCSSHLTVIVLFYGTAAVTYFRPKPNQTKALGKLLSLFYTILTPMMNPIIYTLRNKDVMVALKKLLPKLMKQEKSEDGNQTEQIEFVLLGFTDSSLLQWFLFGLFLMIYIIIVLNNGTIVLISKLDPALHSPMYFFLANFSILEICFVTVTLPKMLMNLGTQRRRISLLACATQMCFFITLGATECLLLTVMAYDRYVAICNPLHYPLVMNHRVCVQLVAGSWITGIPFQIVQTYKLFSLPFCHSKHIDHFCCDIPPILKLACGDTFINEMLLYIAAILFVTIPFLLILGSYSKIISTILKLPSATSQTKAFSTCSSHLMVVVLFFGSGVITYLRPKTSHTEGIDKILSLFYTTLTPIFNPLIYSLRNKDVTMALRKFLYK
ncbi:olfactory receptor 5V1-like [Rhynchocyon petersi]